MIKLTSADVADIIQRRRQGDTLATIAATYQVGKSTLRAHLSRAGLTDPKHTGRREPACGTRAGYRRHQFRGETPCHDCRTYTNDVNRRRNRFRPDPDTEAVLTQTIRPDSDGRMPDLPCRVGPDYWLSEVRAEREEAALYCTGCPVLDACRAYAQQTRPVFGVYAGHDWTPR